MLNPAGTAKSLATVVYLALIPACATATGTGETSAVDGSPGPRPRSSKVLTSEDLDEVFQLSAFQAVELLRPIWLRIRGAVSMESSSSQGVRLYVDGNPRGWAKELEGILASDILEMRFLDSREATIRYGTGYPDGVIVVTTKRRH
jgi:hypothetical protein